MMQLVDGDRRPLEIEQIEQLLYQVVEDSRNQGTPCCGDYANEGR